MEMSALGLLDVDVVELSGTSDRSLHFTIRAKMETYTLKLVRDPHCEV